jgi:hypothetical protein
MRDMSRALPPIELVQKGGDPDKTIVWACGGCKIARASKQEALECCAPWACETCGKDIKAYSYCDECTGKERAAVEKAQYDAAQKVMLSEYAGEWLYCDHCNEYYEDAYALLDAHDDAEEYPTWAFGTTAQSFTLNAEDIISQQLEQQEFYEDAFSRFKAEDIKEMQDFFDAWLKKLDVQSYMVDQTVVVNFEALAEKYKRGDSITVDSRSC